MRNNPQRSFQDERHLTRFNRVPAKIRLVYTDDTGKELNAEATATQAWQMTEETGLDLVMIVPGANPPVVRLCDYGKFKFAEDKHKKEIARSNREHTRTVKELRINQGIGPADYARALKKINEWLPNHDVRLEVTMKGFRGRANRLSIPRGMSQEDMPKWPDFILNKVIRDLGEQVKSDRISVGMNGIHTLVRPA